MELKEFKELLFKKAKDSGFEDCEVYVVSSESLVIGIYNGDVDSYKLNKSFGLSFRGMFDNKIGYSYTQLLDEDSINVLIESAKNSASLIENEDKQFIYEGDESYSDIKSYSENLDNINPNDLIQLGLDIEKECKNYEESFVNVYSLQLVYSKSKKEISNTKGLNLKKDDNILYTIIYPVIEKNGIKYNGEGYKIANSIDEIKPKEIAKEAIDIALSKVGAKSVKTGNYKIAIHNEAMSSLLETYSTVFSADAAQKGLSLLKDKEGSMIASEKVSIIDNPLLEDGLSSTPFDDEGVATFKKELVSKGEFKTFLHNLKTAYKANVKTTGNGFKNSYKSSVSVLNSNMYIEKGDLSFDDILKTLEEGLLITNLEGLHSGANAISGDFSLSARGFYIKNGKKDYPIEQITVSGNFFDLLKNIKEIGDDLVFPISDIGSPTVIVEGLTVAGK